MKIEDFNNLLKEEQIQLVLTEGKYIAGRDVQNFAVNLYSLYHYYCEVWYSIDQNSLDVIKSFDSVHALEPYLNLIHLDLDL